MLVPPCGYGQEHWWMMLVPRSSHGKEHWLMILVLPSSNGREQFSITHCLLFILSEVSKQFGGIGGQVTWSP
jgi:hypothetical protein